MGFDHMTAPRRYGISLAAICLIFITANTFHFLRRVSCWDCFFPYGVPFTLYRAGGEGGGAGVVWTGLAADVGLLLLIALVVGRCWNALARLSQEG